MNKKITLLLSAALFFIPAFSQVSSNRQPTNSVDSLAGFQADFLSKQSGQEQDPICIANQIRLAKRDYIDQKYHLGNYAPEAVAARSQNTANPPTVQAACSNVNFETGNFSNWTGYIGDNNYSNAGPLYNITSGFFTIGNDAPINNSNARHTIITSAYGNDPYGGFPGVPSGSGNYTVRMGGETPNYQGEIMEQTFTVSPSNLYFTCRYAVVLNDPQVGHVYTAKPYFKIEILDSNNQVLSPCHQYFDVADGATLNGFSLSPLTPPTGGVAYYKPWTDLAFDLSSYMNRNVTVRVTVAGCTQSGHFGYCYFDCECSYVSPTHFCFGDPYLYLAAPAGYASYQWYNQNQVLIPGATDDSLLINNPIVGDTFFVFLVSAVDTSCTQMLPVVIISPPALVLNLTHTDETSAGAGNGTASASASGGSPGYTYLWTPGNFTSATISSLAVGTYTCCVTDANGCSTCVVVFVGTVNGMNHYVDPSDGIAIFPNPASDHVQLSISLKQKTDVKLEIYNLLGEQMDVISFGNVNVLDRLYNTTNLEDGIYFFRIYTGETITTRKITVAH